MVHICIPGSTLSILRLAMMVLRFLVKFLLIGAQALAIYCAAKLLHQLIRPFLSPLRNLPGPPSSSFTYGNVHDTRRASPILEEWYEKYGKVMKCKNRFGVDQLFTVDTKAINYILTHSFDYQRATESRFFVTRLLGNGILVTEGEKHREQRRILNPSFSASSIRDVTPIFFEKALELRNKWEEIIADEDWTRLEVLSWMSRTTLDVIGLAGFHHDFNSLEGREESDSDSGSLSNAIGLLLRGADASSSFTVLQASFPIFRIIPDRSTSENRKARNTMLRLGEEWLASREKGGALENGRDLLSVLVRANTDAELPASQRMSNEEVLAQVPTFLIAGHETTSNQMSWALYALAQHQDIQSRLRKELRSVPTETPSADDLSPEKLPFLEMVVRETCRLHGSVTSIIRIATKDDVIPVEEPYFDKNGKIRHEIDIGKGDSILIPILALNRAKHIWGEDAMEFKPDRWANPPAAARSIPGVWADQMTFSGGPRSCIGFRLALMEMKVILFTLIRQFEFSPAVPPEDIEVRSVAINRPSVCGEKGAQLPLLVKLCED